METTSGAEAAAEGLRSGVPDGEGKILRILTRDLDRYQRQILLLQQKIALLEAEAERASSRLAHQRADHLQMLGQSQQRIDTLRRERDDLARTARMLREKLTEIRAVGQENAHTSVLGTVAHVPSAIANLKVAAIMDEFTTSTFAGSCKLCLLDVTGWREQIAAFGPELLFVESAWHGNGGQWNKKISHPSRDLIALVEWCRLNRVPTVLWNKEDPVHFDTFINAAKLFDHVFTTDIDCIGRYKTLLGHDRVYLLPFCGQPKLHNPIERYERKQAFCFAGAYYARYAERQRDLDMFVETLEQLAPVEIFDRNHGDDNPNYRFPDRYARLIQGNLPYDRIDLAYKGYAFGVNLNSVKQSKSMFARRVFDLILSNTHVVSNYSRGLRLMFGDLITATDDPVELTRRMRQFLDGDGGAYRRMHRLLALRKVMLEHTAENRLAYIVSKVSGRRVERELPAVVVVAMAASASELARILSAYDRQRWPHKRLVLVLDYGFRPVMPGASMGRPDISILRRRDAVSVMPAQEWPESLVAWFSTRDYYGANYLTDMALAFLYAPADVVGKAARYTLAGGEPTLRDDDSQYRWQASFALRCAMATSRVLAGTGLADWLSDIEASRICGEANLALDEFNYIADAPVEGLCSLEEPQLDGGLPIEELLNRGERIDRLGHAFDIDQGFGPDAFAELFDNRFNAGKVQLERSDDGLILQSQLGETEHKYLFANRLLDPRELAPTDDASHLNLVAMPGIHLDVVLLFLDADGGRLGQFIKSFGRNHVCVLPQGTASIQLGLRILGPGTTLVAGLATHSMPEVGSVVAQVGRSRDLVLTNTYPSPAHLYRNGFLHRRVLAYKAAGAPTDVFVLDSKKQASAYEFENVDVLLGAQEQLRALLRANAYRTVLVHFLDRAMWSVLKDFLPTTRLIVWVHGAEVQPWQRRAFNYTDALAQERAESDSRARMSLWREIFDLGQEHPNLHFVFVSKYLAEEVMEDYSISLSPASYSVIHNVVDGDLFPYRPKPPEQRLKFLSIRPYASRKYANDLTVRAIELLKDKPYFSDLQFRLVGDGPLLEETVAPLRGLSNVIIDQNFLSQSQISSLHRDYGVFLNPTRWDSQGVSRDEAMASGLVPITNRTSAIPEFVDDSCGFMVPEEDAQAIADAMEALILDPELFQRMSLSASQRPRAQSSVRNTVEREIALIRGEPDGVA